MVTLVKRKNNVLVFIDGALATTIKDTSIDEVTAWLKTVIKFDSLKVTIRD